MIEVRYNNSTMPARRHGTITRIRRYRSPSRERYIVRACGRCGAFSRCCFFNLRDCICAYRVSYIFHYVNYSLRRAAVLFSVRRTSGVPLFAKTGLLRGKGQMRTCERNVDANASEIFSLVRREREKDREAPSIMYDLEDCESRFNARFRSNRTSPLWGKNESLRLGEVPAIFPGRTYFLTFIYSSLL